MDSTTNFTFPKPALGDKGAVKLVEYNALVDAADAALLAALALKEDEVNKSTDGTLAGNSDTDYPTEQAVKTYVDLRVPQWIDARRYATLALGDAAAVAAGVPLFVSSTWPVVADLSIASPIIAILGADFQVATTKTLTLSGGFIGGLNKFFSCTGTGKVVFGANYVPEVRPEWWGADPSGISDSTDEIQAAINSLPTTTGGVIQFSVGKYLVTPNSLSITTSGTILRGRGATTNGTGDIFGSSLKSAAGTGEMVSYVGASATVTVDSCQINDITLDGQEKTVIGLSLKWVSNFRSKNLWVNECYDDGVYMEQVWDSSFYDLEIEGCGAQATGKVGLHIYNGAVDNCNNLRFFAFHAEGNYGDDVWIDSTADGTGGNHSIWFIGGKCEKSQAVGSYSTKAFKISGYDGVNGRPNQAISIRDMMFSQYMVAGDIGVHFAGSGQVNVDTCFFANNTLGGSSIKVEGPVDGPHIHRITNNGYANASQFLTIDTATCPRDRVWTDGNYNSLYTDTDPRISINSDMVRDRRPMVLETWAGTEQTSGTGEDTLATTTVPAGLLSTFGGLKIQAGGDVSGAAGNKAIKFYFGTEVVEVFPAAALDYAWQLEVTVRNAAVAEQWLDWKLTVMDSPIVITAGVVYPLEDTTADVEVKITCQCADGADIIYLGAWRVAEE